MKVRMLTRMLIIALVCLVSGIFVLSPAKHAWSQGSAESKPADKKADGKDKPAAKTDKEKPAKKEKAQTAKKSRFLEGASRASGAGIVDKSIACFGQAPKIDTVSPDEVKSGDKVTIKGKDFGASGCLNSISFGPGHGAKFEQKNETTVTATVPSMKRKGLVILTLTTASGEDSKPVLIK